eukprot:1177508-Prorocentrum_minimum.AAC.2
MGEFGRRVEQSLTITCLHRRRQSLQEAGGGELLPGEHGQEVAPAGSPPRHPQLRSRELIGRLYLPMSQKSALTNSPVTPSTKLNTKITYLTRVDLTPTTGRSNPDKGSI